MPWKETNAMKERELFIKEMLEKKMPFKYLCDSYGISEKTGHKWKNRFFELGKLGLIDESRKRKNHPNELDEDTVIAIIGLKTNHKFWGAKKILAIYKTANPHKQCPSLSSVNRILAKAGLVEKRKVRKVSQTPAVFSNLIQAQQANDVWAIDFKGWWYSNNEICEPFTVRDLYSRKVLCAKLMNSKSSKAVKAVMIDLFKKYGLPKVIRSDNGTPFTSPNSNLSLTNLSAWWITLGILPNRTKKGCPGQNGSLERFHADISREVQGRVPGGRSENQVVLDAWVDEYNSVRPNEAIGFLTPNDLYTPSERKYSGDIDHIEYPLGFLTRKVSAVGYILIDGVSIAISFALKGLQVGLRIIDDYTFEVFLCDILLGTLSTNTACFIPRVLLE